MEGHRRLRRVSDAERALWQLATRDAKPLTGRAPEPPRAAPEPAATTPPADAHRKARAAARARAHPVSTPRAPTAGLDRRTSDRLRRGQLPVEARLDLHGMTREAARAALDHFIGSAAGRGLRLVLVITGKGTQPRAEPDAFWTERGSGVLRREVPFWLHEQPNRPVVLAFAEARPEHGGAGALYVLLRRKRS